MNKFFNKAFTLTEVLTVLAIIGVIASMTMPVLITNINEHKNMTMLKKLYSSYTVNIKSMLNSEYATSCSSLSCLRKWGNGVDEDETNEHKHNGALADTRYFNIRGECVGDCLTDYFNEESVLPNNDIKFSTENKTISGTLYLLPNSAAVWIYDYDKDMNCTQMMNGNFKYCSILMFDTNGAKGPNAPCVDRFAFYVANEPYGYDDDAANIHNQPNYLVPFGYNNYDNTGENNVFNCTAKIMANGWKK